MSNDKQPPEPDARDAVIARLSVENEELNRALHAALERNEKARETLAKVSDGLRSGTSYWRP